VYLPLMLILPRVISIKRSIFGSYTLELSVLMDCFIHSTTYLPYSQELHMLVVVLPAWASR
jgi:hypothetical protein